MVKRGSFPHPKPTLRNKSSSSTRLKLVQLSLLQELAQQDSRNCCHNLYALVNGGQYLFFFYRSRSCVLYLGTEILKLDPIFFAAVKIRNSHLLEVILWLAGSSSAAMQWLRTPMIETYNGWSEQVQPSPAVARAVSINHYNCILQRYWVCMVYSIVCSMAYGIQYSSSFAMQRLSPVRQ